MRHTSIIVEKQSGSPIRPNMGLPFFATALVGLLAGCTPREEPHPDTPSSSLVGFVFVPDPTADAGETKAARPCPSEMILIEGTYCASSKQTCLHWVDPPTSAYPNTRCAEWKNPPTCEGPREHRRYCIDREEYVRPPEVLPLVHVNWNDAMAACQDKGGRLCTEAEWQFACEGEEMRPYPYGFVRDSSICNFDRTDLGKPEEGLTDHRAPLDAFPSCLSPFGVHDMVGNVDEWTWSERAAAPNRSVLHGGWWLPGRNNCRQATYGHTENYTAPQVGFRCCKEAAAP